MIPSDPCPSLLPLTLRHTTTSPSHSCDTLLFLHPPSPLFPWFIACFLPEQDVKARFCEQYGPSMHSAPAFSMNAEFAPTLQRQMNAFNNDPPGDSLQVNTTTLQLPSPHHPITTCHAARSVCVLRPDCFFFLVRLNYSTLVLRPDFVLFCVALDHATVPYPIPTAARVCRPS